MSDKFKNDDVLAGIRDAFSDFLELKDFGKTDERPLYQIESGVGKAFKSFLSHSQDFASHRSPENKPMGIMKNAIYRAAKEEIGRFLDENRDEIIEAISKNNADI
jgi:hypothetical protein